MFSKSTDEVFGMQLAADDEIYSRLMSIGRKYLSVYLPVLR